MPSMLRIFTAHIAWQLRKLSRSNLFVMPHLFSFGEKFYSNVDGAGPESFLTPPGRLQLSRLCQARPSQMRK